MPRQPGRLREIAVLFTRLGFTAFGGPAAHVAMMEHEVVGRRRWLDRRSFLDLVAAINFIPGPNSTELAIHLGLIRGGFAGLLVAGLCFILPAVLIILPLAWLYVTYGSLPRVQGVMAGINACVVAIVAVALWRFARTGIHDRFTCVIAIIAAVAGLGATYADSLARGLHRIGIVGPPPSTSIEHRLAMFQPELIILALSALAGVIWSMRSDARRNATTALALAPLPLAVAPATMAASNESLATGLLAMGLFFLKVGATLFGSGYVLVSYLRSGLVEGHAWLDDRQLLDAVAVGQVTPGPLLTTATFVGYLLGATRFGGGVAGGVAGALLATFAIFLPSFVFIACLGHLIPRLRQSPLAARALDAVNAAVVALILVVTVRLAQASLGSPMALLITAGSLGALLRWNMNSTWLIVGSGVIGYTWSALAG
ncbi:MAG: chromate transporter [Tepidisphaeraceae bacterium]